MGLRKDLEQALATIEELKKRIVELENRLNQYENSNTPSSQRRFKENTKEEPDDEKPRFPGAPLNHKGAGIKIPKPDKIIYHTLDDINLKFVGKYSRIVIDFVDKPLEVTKHIIYQYENKAGEIIEPELDLPNKIYGRNLQALLLQLKSISERTHIIMSSFIRAIRPDLSICSSTILNIIDDVGKNLEQPRNNVQENIQKSFYVHADETGMRRDGKNGYIWVFCNQDYALYHYDRSRARAVPQQILGANYQGFLVNDGYNAYNIYVHQRCWCHILREADALAENFPDSKLQVKHLYEIYSLAIKAKLEPPDKRREIIKILSGQTELGHIIEVLKVTKGCKKFAGTLERASPHLFLGVKHPEIPLHNNFAERTIRPIVIHRKLMGCIKNEKGERFINNTMSMIQTWKLQGENIHEMLLGYAR
jgi:transposase